MNEDAQKRAFKAPISGTTTGQDFVRSGECAGGHFSLVSPARKGNPIRNTADRAGIEPSGDRGPLKILRSRANENEEQSLLLILGAIKSAPVPSIGG